MQLKTEPHLAGFTLKPSLYYFQITTRIEGKMMIYNVGCVVKNRNVIELCQQMCFKTHLVSKRRPEAVVLFQLFHCY
jgi:hypothetical protein